jgi:hypothetical protein
MTAAAQLLSRMYALVDRITEEGPVPEPDFRVIEEAARELADVARQLTLSADATSGRTAVSRVTST